MITAIIAIGGNALMKAGEQGTITQQFANSRETCDKLIQLVELGYKIIITHGNGPQVGFSLRRHENSRNDIPPYPLGVCVAETVGSMGYMLQQTMQNTVKKKGLGADTVTIITQVVVDNNDSSFQNPTKPENSCQQKTCRQQAVFDNRRPRGKPVSGLNQKIIN